ncbi:MAG: T9SS type A sorting domain-containing protein [Sphingobacteriales bacterium]|nr:MAG: T9SS type A sorting domain-containing protein [Sphingobacteriales bacterium]
MRLRFTLFLSALLLSAGLLHAQTPTCGADAVNQSLAATDPAFAARMRNSVQNWLSYQQQQSLRRTIINGVDTVYEIPVVIHVMKPVASAAIGTNYNPSTAQLTAMIDYVNQAYAATWPGYAAAGSGGTYFPVRFVLAKRDTACNPTDGILRVDASGVPGYATNGINRSNTNGAADQAVKAVSNWPVADYYNIWVVNKIDGVDGYPGTTGTFTAGYAYFPNGQFYDGTVMLASQAKQGSKTLPHELGHAFSLFHTFEGDNNGTTCPSNANCTTNGDQVCDTDPHIRSNQNCPSGINPCTGTGYNNVVRNFMDYSNCDDRFTAGQRERFLWSLRTYRPGLMSSMGAVAPPTSSAVAACVPTAPSPIGTLDAGPEKVILGSMTAESAGGYRSDGNRTYLDKACLYTATVTAGQTYPLQISTNASIHKVRVWVDLNNNGAFDATELIYTANGGTSPVFSGSWTVPTTGVTTCTPLRMRVIADQTSSTTINACGPLANGQAEDYTVYVKSSLPVATATVTAGGNPSCFGTTLTFGVSLSNSVTAPTYQWFINSTAQAGATGSTFTTATPTNNDRVSVKVKYTGACGADSVLSNVVTVQRSSAVAPTVSIAITSSTSCSGQPITFTATATNPGTTPTFNWKVNGTTVATTTQPTYTNSTFSAGDQVTVQLISSSSCATPNNATSNAVTVQFSAVVPAVTIAASTGTAPACSGKPVTFTATPTNGGTSPLYEWYVNNALQATTGGQFAYQPVTGDQVRATLYSNNPCALPTTANSNILTLVVSPTDTSRISIAITGGTNPGCIDSALKFTATIQNLGPTATITWFVNGTSVATGATYTAILQNGDVVNAVGSTTDPGCRTSDLITSNSITALRTSRPVAPFISFIGGNLVANIANVRWYNGSGRIAGATGMSYHPVASGWYYARATDVNCESDSSNLLRVSMLSVNSFDVSTLSVFPNPSQGTLTLRWSAIPVGAVTVALYNNMGQRLLTEVLTHTPEKQLSMEAFANGTYFLVLRNEAGETATVPVLLKR